jgi:hypothetical protein
MPAPRLSTQRPDPTRLWVRYSLRPWPGPAGFWTDLAEAGVGRDERADSIEPPPVEELDDVFYLPPVSAEMSASRSRLLRSLAGRNTPVLLQLLPGEEEPEVAGGKIVYDLLPALVAGDMSALAELPADSNVIWPLVAPSRARSGVPVLRSRVPTPGFSPPGRSRLARSWAAPRPGQ